MEKLLSTLLLTFGVISITFCQPVQKSELNKLVGFADKNGVQKAPDYYKDNSRFDSGPAVAVSGSASHNVRLKPPLLIDTIVFRTFPEPLPAFWVSPNNVKIDCVWVDSYDYYSVWNTQKLNPYDFDGLNLQDTIRLALADSAGKERSPLDDTYVTSDFGLRRAQWHYGTDIRVKVGTPVYAPFDGIVRINQYERHGYGRYMVIRHKNGLETLYGHLSKTFFNVGDEVKEGDVIGYGGNTGRSTGPHLHFELRYEGNAINPNDVYNFSTNTLRDSVLLITPGTFAYLKEARAIRRVIVRRGDTLSGIAVRNGTTITRICRLNGISRKSIIRPGQKLRIN